MLTGRIVRELVPPAKSLFPGAAARDLAALADVKLELGLTTGADDAWLLKLITRASRAAEHYCNRPFVSALWQEQIWPAKDAYPWQLPPALAPLALSRFPVLGQASPAGTAPPQAPTLSAAAGGALPAAAYSVRLSYVTPLGETALSLPSALPLNSGTLLAVAAPGPDPLKAATGYNVYAGAAAIAETKQNPSPIGILGGWTLPAGGLVAGSAPPQAVTIVENAPLAPAPLAEGVDFLLDRHRGTATRLFAIDGQPRPWALPVTAIYWAGYDRVPDDVEDAVILMVKGRWYARDRDPMIRSQNVEGVYQAAYFFATGPGGQGDLPVDVTAKLDRYRVPVVG